MAMNAKMWLNTGRPLLRGGRNIRSVSTSMTIMGTHSHHQLHQRDTSLLEVTSSSFLSPTMNPPSIRMTCKNPNGHTRAISQLHSPKEMGNLSWSQIFSQLIGGVFEVVQEEVEATVLDVAATMRTVRRGISLLEWGRRTLKRGKKH